MNTKKLIAGVSALVRSQCQLEKIKVRALTWITKDGREIPIRDMSNSHLLNTIWMLEQRVEANRLGIAYSVASIPFGGGMASAEQEVIEDWVLSAPICDLTEMIFPIYAYLVEEMFRRDLKRKLSEPV